MSDVPVIPRMRLPAPGGGNILTRRTLSRMLAELEHAARPRLQAEGALYASGDALRYDPAAEPGGAAEVELRARQIAQAVIPGRARVITRGGFITALSRVLQGLGVRLQVDGAEKLTEDTDGGITLVIPRSVTRNVYIFIQVSVFDSMTGDFTTPIELAASWFPETSIFTTTGVWSITQMLELPAATPPNTRTIEVTDQVRYRDASIAGDPTWGDPDLSYQGPVELAMKKWNAVSSSVDTTFDVLIDDPAGVTHPYSTTAARSGDTLLPTGLTVL